MRIIRPTLPEPPDQVIQNLTIGEFPLGPVFEPWQDLGNNWHGENVLQGEWTTSRMPEFAVPRALIGWNPYFAQADKIGPMAIQGGLVVWPQIGPAKPVNPIIEVPLRWLSQGFPTDSNGEMGMSWQLPSLPAPDFDRVLSNDNTLAQPVPIASPRREVKDSGSLKILTNANMPEDFGRVIFQLYPAPVSYQVFTLSGVTYNGLGVPEGNARVILYQSGWRYVQTGEKIIAETISNGSGNFSFLVRNIDYQLTGYKVGTPDLGGITRQDVVPTAVSTSIYMRDPTVPSSGGGGGETSYTFVG